MDEKAAKKAKILKEFGANLNRLIRERYRSRDAFLKKTDLEIYKADLHHMIKGDRDPQLSTLYKIAEALKVSARDLIPPDK
jgi:predicted transcriptional regulator